MPQYIDVPITDYSLDMKNGLIKSKFSGILKSIPVNISHKYCTNNSL